MDDLKLFVKILKSDLCDTDAFCQKYNNKLDNYLRVFKTGLVRQNENNSVLANDLKIGEINISDVEDLDYVSNSEDESGRRPRRTASKAAGLKIKKNLNLPLKLRRPSSGTVLNGTLKTRTTRTKVIKKCKRSEVQHLPEASNVEVHEEHRDAAEECSTRSAAREKTNLVKMRTEQFEQMTKKTDAQPKQEEKTSDCQLDNRPTSTSALTALDSVNNNITAPTLGLEEQDNTVQSTTTSNTRVTRTKTRNIAKQLKNANETKDKRISTDSADLATRIEQETLQKRREQELAKKRQEEEELNRKKEELLAKRKEDEAVAKKKEQEAASNKKRQQEALAKKKEQEAAAKKKAIEKKHQDLETKRALAAKKREEMMLAKKKEQEAAAKKKETDSKALRALKEKESKENCEPDQHLKIEKKAQNPNLNKLKQNDTYTMTPPREGRTAVKPKTKDDYGIDDVETSDSSDDESKPKKILPEWANTANIMPGVILQSKVPLKLFSFAMKCKTDPYTTLGYENKIKRPRTSSAVWHSPLLSKSVLMSFN